MEFKFDETGRILKECISYNEDEIIVPDGTVEIGTYAFQNAYTKSIILPNSVKYIDFKAFYSMSSLKSVTVPDHIIHVDSYAFPSRVKIKSRYDGFIINGNHLLKYSGQEKNVIIPDCVEVIDDLAFCDQTEITGITLPDSLTSIGNDAFLNCSSLKRINLHDNIVHIGNSAFKNCEDLETINIPQKLTEIPNRCFTGCKMLTEIVIPDNIESIAHEVFMDCTELQSVSFSQNLKSIKTGVFRNCKSLKEVTLPNSVELIQAGAFYSCTNLKSIKLPGNIKSIQPYTFNKCSSLEKVILPKNNVSIERYAFGNCTSICEIELPDSLASIDCYAFYNCSSLKSIKFSDKIENIAVSSFENCPLLNTAEFPEYILNIMYPAEIPTDEHGFQIENTKLIKYKGNAEHVVIPDGITKICFQAFKSNHTMRSVVIPESVTCIDINAFYDTNLESVTIPANVDEINSGAFYNCTRLKSVTIDGADCIIKEDAFSNSTSLSEFRCDNDADISVFKESFENCPALYRNGYLILRNNLVSYDGEDTDLVIPEGVENIFQGALGGDTFLNSVTLPESLKVIRDDFISDNNNVTELIIPENVKYLSEFAFRECHNLKKLTIRCETDILDKDALPAGLESLPESVEIITAPKVSLNDETIYEKYRFKAAKGYLLNHHEFTDQAIINEYQTWINDNIVTHGKELINLILENDCVFALSLTGTSRDFMLNEIYNRINNAKSKKCADYLCEYIRRYGCSFYIDSFDLFQ